MSAGTHHHIASHENLTAAIEHAAPHLRPILEATRDGLVRFGHIGQHQGSFAFPPGRPIVCLIGDDYDLAWGPQAFDRKSFQQFIKGCRAAVIIAGAPVTKVYATVVAAAILSGRDVAIIETQPRWESDWASLIRSMQPGISMLLSTPASPSRSQH